jgi:hypothetical protein
MVYYKYHSHVVAYVVALFAGVSLPYALATYPP